MVSRVRESPWSTGQSGGIPTAFLVNLEVQKTQATPNTPVNSIQSPFGGASPTSNQYQGGTSPFQHQGQAFGQGGTHPQAPVQESAQAGVPFASYNNAQMQGGYPNNGQLNYQTNSSYMGQAPIPGKKSKKGLIIGLCSLVVVAVLSVLAFFLFAKTLIVFKGNGQLLLN